jgi:hypothetical protein
VKLCSVHTSETILGEFLKPVFQDEKVQDFFGQVAVFFGEGVYGFEAAEKFTVLNVLGTVYGVFPVEGEIVECDIKCLGDFDEDVC